MPVVLSLVAVPSTKWQQPAGGGSLSWIRSALAIVRLVRIVSAIKHVPAARAKSLGGIRATAVGSWTVFFCSRPPPLHHRSRSATTR